MIDPMNVRSIRPAEARGDFGLVLPLLQLIEQRLLALQRAAEIEQAVTRLKDAMQGDDAARIRQATQHLAKVSTRLNQATGNAAGAEAGNTTGADQSDVIDAEFKEVDDQDRKAS